MNFEAGGAWFSDDKILVFICIGGLKTPNLPKPYSTIQGASLDGEIQSAAWYCVQHLWKILKRKGTSPLPLSVTDKHVNGLARALVRWKTAKRADVAYKRLAAADARRG
jgi:hypothetical protein